MNKECIKGMIAGFILCIILSTSVLVLANTVTKEITYGVRVNLNGQLMQFDSESQPFVMEGRTFLPVRAIADAMGLDVAFDADTNTAYLSSGTVNVQLPELPVAQTPAAEPTLEPTPEPIAPQEAPTALSQTSLTAGHWVVGRDIAPGRYVVTPATGAGSGNFFARTAADRSHINAILNENAITTGRGVPSVTADFNEGYTIEVSGLNEVVFTPASRSQSNTLTAGHWVVGQDIAPGRYVITPGVGAGSGNFFARTTADRSHVNAILNENAEETGRGVVSVTADLRDGYTIEISGLMQVVFTPAS